MSLLIAIPLYGVLASLVCGGIAWWALWHFAGPRDIQVRCELNRDDIR